MVFCATLFLLPLQMTQQFSLVFLSQDLFQNIKAFNEILQSRNEKENLHYIYYEVIQCRM